MGAPIGAFCKIDIDNAVELVHLQLQNIHYFVIRRNPELHLLFYAKRTNDNG